MDKQKIEELAKDVFGAITQCPLNTKGHCRDCEFRGEKCLDCQSWFVASMLMEQGYKKISKNHVVLLRDEYLEKRYNEWKSKNK